jgi:hypothetical protein
MVFSRNTCAPSTYLKSLSGENRDYLLLENYYWQEGFL